MPDYFLVLFALAHHHARHAAAAAHAAATHTAGTWVPSAASAAKGIHAAMGVVLVICGLVAVVAVLKVIFGRSSSNSA